ncbi:MAG: Gfo/Idh/MocA family oxidoreductase [Fimbriimonadaceae bacterium]|nr:Gfo/Idh/MocA family oxidoreductase [Fimbriimonadaceae bacterium]
MADRFRLVLVGAGAMGRGLLQDAFAVPEIRPVGVCEPLEANCQAVADQWPDLSLFETWDQAVESIGPPEIAVIATPNFNHAELALQAVASGVRAIFLEKPMAVHLADARWIVEACESAGVLLVVNHQRRLLPELIKMREVIASGVLGSIELIRSCGAGDFLSDGTHAVDSVRHLLGDVQAEWVFGQVFRAPNPESVVGEDGVWTGPGCRYGHPVEEAALAVAGFPDGVRAEFHWGSLFPAGRWYQDYEVIGSRGRLHRFPDGREGPRLEIDLGGGWEPLPFDETPGPSALARLARSLETGENHPMNGRVGLADMELVTAVYESAARRVRVEMPPSAGRFPLLDLLS